MVYFRSGQRLIVAKGHAAARSQRRAEGGDDIRHHRFLTVIGWDWPIDGSQYRELGQQPGRFRAAAGGDAIGDFDAGLH
jgi:hypothetical protein